MEASRAATCEDVPRMAELARAAIAELSSMRGGAVWRARESRPEPVETGLARLVGDPGACLVVGTIDDTIVGYGVARSEPMVNGSALGVIDDIFVEQGARGIGLGEAMMGDLMRWCVEQGCVGIDAIALPGHRQTKNFFEENGFVARKIVMHRSLAGRDPPEVG